MAVLIFIILTTLFALVSSQGAYDPVYNCYPDYNPSKSQYTTSLNTLLPSLSSNIGDDGFYTASEGPANAIVLCRGDIQLDECRVCVSTVAQRIVQDCPDRMRAIIWALNCMLRYSDESMLGAMATTPNINSTYSNLNVTRPDRFKGALETLMNDLRSVAAKGSSGLKAAAGIGSGPDGQTIYAMLQCTPDLSIESCDSCLSQAAELIPTWYPIGARIYMPSCNIRYENFSFYNITRLQESRDQPPTVLPPPSSGSRKRNIIIISVVSCLVLVVCIGIFARKVRTKQKPKQNPETLLDEADDDIISIDSIHYDFEKIRAATNDFSDDNKLGQGGFGAVYWGTLENGQEIGVKRLSMNSSQGDAEFKNEVLLLVKLQHKNLVRLLGFASQGRERLLVYEYVRNGSLDNFIFDPIKASSLDWDKRYTIIRGIARGLLYLHEDSMLRIIHRDLKASNVLLDENMNPKISDFGMARLLELDQTQDTTSRIVGTYGYMAPEYMSHGQFSVKSDVFSFGVLVLELVSGKDRRSSLGHDSSQEYPLSYAWRNWRQGTTADVIDPILRATSSFQIDMLRCIHIALLCVQENAADRPTMSSVVLMLNGSSLTLPIPSQPAFHLPNSREWESSTSSRSNTMQPRSNNDVSISEFGPR